MERLNFDNLNKCACTLIVEKIDEMVDWINEKEKTKVHCTCSANLEFTDEDVLDQIDIPDKFINSDTSTLYGKELEDHLIHELGLEKQEEDS